MLKRKQATLLTARYQQQRTQLQMRTGALLRAQFQQYGDISDPRPFVVRAVPAAQSAQKQAARLNAAYMGRLMERPYKYAVEDYIGPSTRNGAKPEDVYFRPIKVARIALAAGTIYAAAMLQGQQRAGLLAETDVQLTQRKLMRDLSAQTDGIIGYRRVNSGSGCSFCDQASEAIYRDEDLMPLHPGCMCSVAPVMRSDDPGSAVTNDNTEDEEPPEHEPMKIVEHDELGPMFWNANDHFETMNE